MIDRVPPNTGHRIDREGIAMLRGLTRGTVRAYISAGILPPPDDDGMWDLAVIVAWHRNRPLRGASNLWLTRMTREEADEAGRLWRD